MKMHGETIKITYHTISHFLGFFILKFSASISRGHFFPDRCLYCTSCHATWSAAAHHNPQCFYHHRLPYCFLKHLCINTELRMY